MPWSHQPQDSIDMRTGPRKEESQSESPKNCAVTTGATVVKTREIAITTHEHVVVVIPLATGVFLLVLCGNEEVRITYTYGMHLWVCNPMHCIWR